MKYERTQTGWPVRVSFGLAALGFLAMSALHPFDRPLARAALLGGAGLAVALGLAWSRLTVRIERDRLHWAYGPGWPRFSLPLADIAKVEAMRTTFWHGWGIHRVRGGWVYNIAGRDALRIARSDGRLVLLGTDEPRRLKAELERAMAAAAPGRRRG